jgi:NAD(P)-dependent dehydrogenase (short-subunit alcohol dehydrogenase family)
MHLAEKVVLVTGAGRRVGKAIALELGGAGARIVVHYHESAAPATATVDELRALGCEALPIRADLSQVREIESLVAEVANHVGRLDVLVNSAAVFFPTRFGATRESEWDDLLDTNLKGPFFLCQLAAALMMAAGGGAIVNIADVSAEIPWTRYLPYCISKAGVVAMTKGLARTLAPRVRVNAVAPGPVLLPEHFTSGQRERAIRSTLLGREGTPEDVARAVRYLIEASYVTGVILPVDGGRHLATGEPPSPGQ